MFGLSHELSDPSLYLLPDMVVGMLADAEQLLEKTPKGDTAAVNELLEKIDFYKQQLSTFESTISKKRKQSFQFSVEEFFYQYGQYDAFVAIDFHKFSEAATKFGESISGILEYGKNERQKLQEIIAAETIPRTNGLVKISVASNSGLTEAQTKELMETGFRSGDVYQVWNTSSPKANTYTQTGTKEIPYTINVNINADRANAAKLAVHVFNMRLENGGKLTGSEWERYYGFNLYLVPDIKNLPELREKLFTTDGLTLPGIRFYELSAKINNEVMSAEEVNEFKALLVKRREERFQILEEELKSGGISSIVKFKEAHPDIYLEIFKMALVFEDETLNGVKPGLPIYMDFRTYLHIYLRHFAELQPVGHFKEKTTFVYNHKDVRRILKMAVEEFEDKIQTNLAQGRDFRVYGEKAFYFNGNYYSFRIEPDGRVDTFYANENKQERKK